MEDVKGRKVKIEDVKWKMWKGQAFSPRNTVYFTFRNKKGQNKTILLYINIYIYSYFNHDFIFHTLKQFHNFGFILISSFTKLSRIYYNLWLYMKFNTRPNNLISF